MKFTTSVHIIDDKSHLHLRAGLAVVQEKLQNNLTKLKEA